MVSVSFVSFEKYELLMRNSFSKFFSCLFLPKKQSRKTILTSFSRENVDYKTLGYYTKPWTLYLVSVLRNRERNMKNSSNLRFFKTFFQRSHEAESDFFDNFFFNENVPEESAQILARTKVFSYRFSVLRNISYKLGKNGKIFKFLLHLI